MGRSGGRGFGEGSPWEGLNGNCSIRDVLVAPPAGEREPLSESGPPVSEVLIGEPDFGVSGGDSSRVGDAREEATAGSLSDPGSQRTLRSDKEAGLLVDLPDRAALETLTGGEASRGWLPCTTRAPEQEHSAVFTDRKDAGDEICLQTMLGATLLSIILITEYRLSVNALRIWKVRAEISGSGLGVIGVEQGSYDGEARSARPGDLSSGLESHPTDGEPGHRQPHRGDLPH